MLFKTVTILVASLTLAGARPDGRYNLRRQWSNDTSWADWSASSASTTTPPVLIVNNTASATSLGPETAVWSEWVSPTGGSAVGAVTSKGTVTEQVSTTVEEVATTITTAIGGSETVITTTTHISKTFTLTETLYLTTYLPSPTPAGFFEAAGASSAESTSTTVESSATTLTVTVKPEVSTAAAGWAPGAGGSACGVSYVTITTVVQSTVTVTAIPSSTEAPVKAAAPSSSSKAVAPSSSSKAVTPPSSSVAATATKYGNGTESAKTKGPSSGFLTVSKWAAPTGWTDWKP